MNLMLIISGILGVFLVIGALVGALRSWKKATIRFGLLVVCFVLAMILSSKISSLLMNKFVNGMVLSIFGQSINFESIVGDIAGDIVGEGSAMNEFTSALLNIVVKLISFLVVFIVLMIITLIVYYIIAAIMSKSEKKKSVGKLKLKWWERLIGGVVGVFGSMLVCIVLFTPIFGLMNVCDKFLEESSKTETAAAYSQNVYVCGKFYTEDEKIGTVETYLEKYEKLRKSYKKSFAGIMFTCTGADAVGRLTFNKLSTVKQNGMKVDFTAECVNLVNVYNLYKTNFVENKFNLATEQSVDAAQKMYNIAKNSEVLKSFVVDLVPKMADKWTKGEKFMGMDLPVSGDMQEIAIDMLEVFNTKDFDVIDANINVMFEAIKVANRHEIIKDVNAGAEILDVIDRDMFVEDELNTLATTPEMKRALPKIMTTTVKLAYKSVLGDPNPEDKLNQDFTQDQLANITWSSEAEKMQTIVTNMFEVFDKAEILDSLTNIGEVIDAARFSIVSKPVQTLMIDYIDQKTSGDVRSVIRTAISTNWGNPNYSYKSLFATVETTAKVAKDMENMKLTDMTEALQGVLNSDSKQTIEDAIDNGMLDELIGEDAEQLIVYKDLINSVLDYTDDEPLDVSKEMEAGQVVADIINKSSNEEGSKSSMFEGTTEEEKQQEANDAITSLTNSSAVMGMLETEADKTDSAVKGYISDMNDEDKQAFKNAIDAMEEGKDKTTLEKLFGLDSGSVNP